MIFDPIIGSIVMFISPLIFLPQALDVVKNPCNFKLKVWFMNTCFMAYYVGYYSSKNDIPSFMNCSLWLMNYALIVFGIIKPKVKEIWRLKPRKR